MFIETHRKEFFIPYWVLTLTLTTVYTSFCWGDSDFCFLTSTKEASFFYSEQQKQRPVFHSDTLI